MKISKEQARRFLIKYQCLSSKQNGKDGVMEYMKRVRTIQFDPLSVIDINPQLVLQSRIYNYKRDYLNELLYSDRLLIDDWDKNMSIYLTEDWPKFMLYRHHAAGHLIKIDLSKHDVLDKVRRLISEKGPICASDLEFDEKVDWYWGPTRLSRAALESLYFKGELIIHHKEVNRKYYDFTSQHLSRDLMAEADKYLDMELFFRFIVSRRIGSVGLLWNRPGDAWLGICFMKSADRARTIKALLDSGELAEIEIEDIKSPFYLKTSDLDILNGGMNKEESDDSVSFLAPLDNLLWDRKMIEELFGFKYTWDVYKPTELREYGYYVLPVLYQDRFIARFEPRFEKKSRVLEINGWWWEKDVNVTPQIKEKTNTAVNAFGHYLNAEKIIFHRDL